MATTNDEDSVDLGPTTRTPAAVPGDGPAHAADTPAEQEAGLVDLATLRALIDDADLKLLRLLDERMQLAVRAGRLKDVVGDPVREDAVLSPGSAPGATACSTHHS
ncbi:MAG: chorismate mutase [Acidobacteria bacterium]|nr:chorismate mutase [Acidobacteriota bacterium]